MGKAVKVGDIGTQHDGFIPSKIISGSADVIIDGQSAARVGDKLMPHTKPKHPPHPRTIVSGSKTVIINGKPAAISGGSISCGGVTIGSGSVFIGDTVLGAAGADLPTKASPDLQQKLDHAGLTLEQTRAISAEIFTTNANGEVILKTVVVTDSINVSPDTVLTQDTLNRMQARILLNDRANAYLELYQATGEEQLILQAQITTYSGAIGSGALVGNMLAKDAAGDLYNLSLDQFSLDILQGTYDAASAMLGKRISLMDHNFFQDADHQVWANKRMGEYFPGNVQFADYKIHKDPELAKMIYYTPGAYSALQIGQEFMMPRSKIAGLGSRPADFADADGYRTVAGKRFITVIDKASGNIKVFWDKNIEVDTREWPSTLSTHEWPTPFQIKPGQIDNTPRIENAWDYKAGNAVREYLQADNAHIPSYDLNKNFENFSFTRSGFKSFIFDSFVFEQLCLKNANFENLMREKYGLKNVCSSIYLQEIRNEIHEEDLAIWLRRK